MVRTNAALIEMQTSVVLRSSGQIIRDLSTGVAFVQDIFPVAIRIERSSNTES